MGEGEKRPEMAPYIGGEPVEIVSEIGELANVISNAVGKAFREVSTSFVKFANAVLAVNEQAQAVKWAEIYRPRLANIYRHTKKGRVRKKYRKRIVAEYRGRNKCASTKSNENQLV